MQVLSAHYVGVPAVDDPPAPRNTESRLGLGITILTVLEVLTLQKTGKSIWRDGMHFSRKKNMHYVKL